MNFTRRHFLQTAGLFAATGVYPCRGVDATKHGDTPRDDARCIDSIFSDWERGEFRHTSFSADQGGLALLRRPDGTYPASGTYTSPPFGIPSDRPLRLRWLPRWTTPVVWEKYQGNPILTCPGGIVWDAKSVSIPCVLKVPDGFRLYYGSRPVGIGFATAPAHDIHAWVKHLHPILTAGPPGAFDAGGVNAPEVVKVSESHWCMYYVGYHPTEKVDGVAVHQIGLAESHDGGITWRRHSSEPVIPRGATGSYDAFSTSSASVLHAHGRWWMWYGGIAQVPYLAGICLATSDDGYVWRKHEGNPVLPFAPHLPCESAIIAKPHVLHEDGLFKLWYSARGQDPQSAYSIGYAESRDGKKWDRFMENPVVRPAVTGWDRTMVEYAEVLRDEAGYHMWYCGDNYESVGYAQGRAIATIGTQVRTGNTAQPDTSWSAWSPPCEIPTGTMLPHSGNRHMQLRFTLTSENARITPVVQDFAIN